MMKSIIFMAFTIAFSCLSFAQTEIPVLPEKYNGFGLPNTKFKKIPSKAQVEIKKVNTELMPSLKDRPQPSVKLGLDLSVTYGLQSEKQVDGSQYRYLYYEADPVVKFDNYTIGGAFYFYQNLDAAGDNEWYDSAISFSHTAWNLGEYFLLTPYIVYGLPLSKKSRENVFLNSTLGASAVLALNTANIDLPNFVINYSFGYTKMFTSSVVNSKKDPNVDFRLRQRINFGYQFTKKFSFKTRFQFDSAYAQQLSNETLASQGSDITNQKENYITNAFSHYEQLDYSLNDYFGVYGGHTNSNALYNPETYENNLKVFDKQTSEFYIGFGISFKNY